MAESRQLRNPPIAEAVVDIRVEFAAPPTLEALLAIQTRIADVYPERRTLQQVFFNIEINDAAPAKKNVSDPAPAGHIYTSTDKTQVVQCKREGLTFSRLAPYTSWESTTDEMFRLWRIYFELLSPTRIIRVSTRFLNRINLPNPLSDFDDFLTVVPRIPHGVPDTLTNFSSSITVPIGTRTTARIACSFDGAAATDASVPIMLDLDILQDCNFDAKDEEAVFRALRELRPIKNAVFFGSITNKTLELFA